ncbi:hypothetical protein [Spiroplasma ixodetis]|nr:hypothetical protein [Spiroplasma ixodetis]BDT03315.1 hypothetical protein SHM_09610 [Spiroplasma ixodetis]
MLNLDLTKTYKDNGDGTEAEKDIIAKFISYEKICKSNDSLCLAILGKWTSRKKTIKEKAKQLFKAFLPLCTILILSHKCWEKPIYGLLPTFLNQT